MFGTDIHPDLAKLQCEQGALFSYREAASNLEKLNAQRRRINNHDRVKIMTNELGAYIAQENYKAPLAEALPVVAQELIVQVDGGHIPTKDKDKRSFEALAAIVYRPGSMEVLDEHHRRITDKSCAISAKDDELSTIKTYLQHAALKQGLTKETHVTAVCDGANNCWSVIQALQSHCQSLELILDWFHIAKKFQNLKALGEELTESLENAKCSLWHGSVAESRKQLTILQSNITDEKKRSQLQSLQDYLENNRPYLVNYSERKNTNKPFTSQVAESHIDTIINTRHRRKQKMQWTREGAHNVLQIRALMVSNGWENKWLDYVMPNPGKAA